MGFRASLHVSHTVLRGCLSYGRSRAWSIGRHDSAGPLSPHRAAFIRNQRSTPGTTDFAGQNTLMLIKLAIVETEVIEALRDANVAFVKDGRPLHGRAVQLLADHAVADFRVHRICAHFLLDGLTLTPGVVFCRKRLIPNRCKYFSKFFLHSGAAI